MLAPLAVVALLASSGSVPLAGQEPAPRDTLAPSDTLPPPADAPPSDTLPDGDPAPPEPEPPPRLPALPSPPAGGWSDAVWAWEREELLAMPAFSLADLLELLPGITRLSGGFVGHPEAVASLGTAGGRLEVVLDGFDLDPLGRSAPDLARIELSSLERVLVERRGGGVRVELTTSVPVEASAYSRVEAFTGDLGTDVFRGLFLAPRALIGPLALGLEHVGTEGPGAREPATSFAGWGSWSVAGRGWGVQLQGRRHRVDRGAGSPLAGESTRRDLVVRGRATVLPGLVAEAHLGRSSLDGVDAGFADAVIDPEAGPQEPEPRVLRSRQAGMRVGLSRDGLWARSALRFRSEPGLPSREAELDGGVALLGLLRLSGSLLHAEWEGAGGALSATARLVVEPLPGVRALGELGAGERGVPFVAGRADSVRLTDVRSLRLGGEVERFGVRLGAAFLDTRVDSVAGFGPGIDGPVALRTGGEARGLELSGRARLFRDFLRVEGWLVEWTGGGLWSYMPGRSWNAALVYDHLPLPSGNLHVLARLEHARRGAMLAPEEGGGDGEGAAVVLPAFDQLNFRLQVRILDVWVFVRWENIRNEQALMLPGRPLVPQRALYGVKWEFLN